MRKLLLTFCALVLQPLLAACLALSLPKGGLAQQPTRFIEIPADALEDKIRGACSPKSSATSTACHTNSNTINEPGHVETLQPLAPKGRLYRRRYRHRVVYLRAISKSGDNLLPNATSRRSGSDTSIAASLPRTASPAT